MIPSGERVDLVQQEQTEMSCLVLYLRKIIIKKLFFSQEKE